jgi:hypothetical protein
MFEYIFSHKNLADEFCEYLRQMSVPYAAKDDDLGFVVSVSEDLDDELLDQVEAFYDIQMDKSEKLLDAESEEAGKHVAAITIHLKDGRVAQAMVRPELMNKLLQVLSFAELNEIVESITDSVENPDSRPICKR